MFRVAEDDASAAFGWRRQRGGLKIVHVEAGGQAAAAGVRVGWRITAVNDVDTPSEEDFKRALAAAKTNGQESVAVTFSQVACANVVHACGGLVVGNVPALTRWIYYLGAAEMAP